MVFDVAFIFPLFKAYDLLENRVLNL